MPTAIIQSEKIKTAREEIMRVLDRYKITLPEALGTYKPYKSEEDPDEKNWNMVRNEYRKAQIKILKETYPALAKKKK
jgi:hypothetical protein